MTDLRYESNITWVKDIQDIRFVRIQPADFAYRKGLTDADRNRLEDGDQVLIGYADLHDNAPLKQTKSMAGDDYYYCMRRTFVIYSDDLTAPNYANNCPIEAVDPLTISPMVEGERNDRAMGRSQG